MDKNEMAHLAYELYVSSGCKEGRDLDNWLEAERILSAKEELELERKSVLKAGIQLENAPVLQEQSVVL
jgi:hypothetical protein